MKHSTLSLAKAFSPLLLLTVPLASAKCNSMKLLGPADGEDVGTSDSDKQIFRVTDIIECDSINGEVTPCDVPPQDPVALTVHPEIRGVDSVTNETNIFDLIRAQASNTGLAGVNFNRTVYYNFSIPGGGVDLTAASPRNYYFWIPRFRCWQGILHDCDDTDKQLEDKNITGCSLVWLDGTEGLPLDQQAYRGTHMGIQDTGGDFFLNGTEESQPKSADFDWAAAEVEIEKNNPKSQESGAGISVDSGLSKLMGQGFGAAWLATFLLL